MLSTIPGLTTFFQGVSASHEKNISKGVAERYGTDRLWRIELIGYWRLIYTIIGDEVKIITFILEFMDHKRYDKIFGYKKK